MFRKQILSAGIFVALVASSAFSGSSQPIIISPASFDFGWCPDNAKISAQFKIKNVGVDMIPITSVQPTCGCTASQFTPGALASNEETKVGLTFNTRGYTGMEFHKATKIKTEAAEAEYSVMLSGHVTDPNAKFSPDGDGIAAFGPDSKEKTKSVTLRNRGDKPLMLDVVQAPAEWAKVKVQSQSVKAGETVNLDITVPDTNFSEERDTSMTLAYNDGSVTKNVTIAIRTGQGPAPARRIQAPAPSGSSPAKPNKPK